MDGLVSTGIRIPNTILNIFFSNKKIFLGFFDKIPDHRFLEKNETAETIDNTGISEEQEIHDRNTTSIFFPLSNNAASKNGFLGVKKYFRFSTKMAG